MSLQPFVHARCRYRLGVRGRSTDRLFAAASELALQALQDRIERKRNAEGVGAGRAERAGHRAGSGLLAHARKRERRCFAE